MNYIEISTKNLKKITEGNNLYNETTMNELTEGGIGINWIDLFFLDKYLKFNNITKILEIGCGTSTVFLENSNYEIETIALDYTTLMRHGSLNLHAVLKNRNIKFSKLDFCLDSNLDKVYELLKDKEFVLIDGDHSYAFAKRYFDVILSKFKLPVLPVLVLFPV